MALNHKKWVWDYSTASDILHIHKAERKTAGSAELDEFTVDFDKEGSVVGLDIEHASEFLSQVGIAPAELARLESAELIIQRKNTCMLIFVKLYLNKKEHTIPIPAPVLCT